MNLTGWVESLPIKIPFDLKALAAEPIEPKRPFLEERDEVLGDMSDNQKLAYSLWQRCCYEARLAKLEFEHGRTDDYEKEMAARHDRMVQLEDVFKNIFWTMVLDQIGYSERDIAVCRGFKIVKSPYPNSLTDILDMARIAATHPDESRVEETVEA